MKGNKLKSLFFYSSLAYLLLLSFIFSITFWPTELWWVANIVSIGPVWIFVLPLILIIPATFFFRTKVFFLLNIVNFVLAYKIIGLVISPAGFVDRDFRSLMELKVMTANLGNGGDINQVSRIIGKQSLDVVALQETSQIHVKSIAAPLGWNFKCAGELCLLSRYKVRIIDSKSRRFLNDWGAFVAHFKMNLPTRIVDLFIVHLQTPREGLQEMIFSPIEGIPLMKKVTGHQHIESWIASNWAGQGRNSIVAGDFNMSIINPMYHKHWSWLRNSFNDSGLGFGYSKFTRWHGVRIDHILYDGYQWVAKKAWVGAELGGDHLPVIAILEPR